MSRQAKKAMNTGNAKGGKGGGAEDAGENGGQDEMNHADSDDNAQKDLEGKFSFYRGFNRKDINEMLKEYAREMYERNVRNEEMLLIKIRPDQNEQIGDLQVAGAQKSFFNRDKNEKELQVKKQIEEVNQLDESEELKQVRAVFTPDEMLAIWQQLFMGIYMLVPKYSDQKAKDKDGKFEHRIERLENEENIDQLEERVADVMNE